MQSKSFVYTIHIKACSKAMVILAISDHCWSPVAANRTQDKEDKIEGF